MTPTSRCRLGTLAAALMIAVAITPARAAGADQSAERHCVVVVVDQRPDGELVTGPETCYPTPVGAAGSSGGEAPTMQTTSSIVLAVHYDGANFTGSSLTVWGSACNGGYLNLSSSWVNRISSTNNICYRVRHFDGYSLTGASEDTVGSGGNLGGLNNAANSVQYFA